MTGDRAGRGGASRPCVDRAPRGRHRDGARRSGRTVPAALFCTVVTHGGNSCRSWAWGATRHDNGFVPWDEMDGSLDVDQRPAVRRGTGGAAVLVVTSPSGPPVTCSHVAHRGGQARTRRPRPRRQGGGPRAARRRPRGHLHGSAPDPEQIVETAIQEDADAVGLSVLSGAHMTLFRKLIELLAGARRRRHRGLRRRHRPRGGRGPPRGAGGRQDLHPRRHDRARSPAGCSEHFAEETLS